MKSFAVIGLGRFGTSVATSLYNLGQEVLAIDSSQEKIEFIEPYVTHALQVDISNPHALRELGLRNFDVVIISIGDDLETASLATLICKDMGCKYILVKASNELHAKILEKIGADRVIIPERSMGERVAHNLVSSGIVDFMELSPDFGLVEITPPPSWQDKSLIALNLRQRLGITVIAIRRGTEVIVSPEAEEVIHEDDTLIIVGKNEQITRLETKHLNRK